MIRLNPKQLKNKKKKQKAQTKSCAFTLPEKESSYDERTDIMVEIPEEIIGNAIRKKIEETIGSIKGKIELGI